MTAAPETEDRPREDLETIAGRLDETMASIAALPADARQAVNAALTSLDSLHRQALVAIVRRLREDPRGKELLFGLVDEPVVRMVLSMHEIIRPDPTTTARRVLDTVRGGLQSHGGDVALDRIEGTTAYVRLQGACNGCSMASVTMRGSVEEALLAGVPGLTAVEVVPNDPSPALIPLGSIGVRSPEASELEESGWVATVRLADLPADEATPVADVDAILLVNGGSVAAYRNECAHQGMPLDTALVDPDAGTITCAWHGLSYDVATGECVSLPGGQLEPLPTRVVDGLVWIRRG